MSVRVAVIGLGKLGLPLAAFFLDRGCHVCGSDPRFTEELLMGSDTDEPGVAEILYRKPLPIVSTRKAVESSEIVFIVVPTPSERGGSFSLQHILSACDEIGVALADTCFVRTIVVTSTVMPGSTSGPIQTALESASGKKAGQDFFLVYHPEFIALGEVLKGLATPDVLLMGTEDSLGLAMLGSLYNSIGVRAPIRAMNPVNAEIAKLMVNAFVTAKISYANLVARLCEKVPHGDAHIITEAMGLDHRIGPAYLNPGVPFGGPCFPRDNAALQSFCTSVGVLGLLPLAVSQFNGSQIEDLAHVIRRLASGRVRVLGLGYKPGTQVTTESFGWALQKQLSDIVTQDGDCGTVVLALPGQYDLELLKGKLVIDCWSCCYVVPKDCRYISLGHYLGV